MRALMKFCRLFLALLLICCVLPAQADIPSPERSLRRARLHAWRKEFPHLTPTLDISLDQQGKNLLLRLAFKCPASYSVRLGYSNGDGALAGGSITELGGEVRTERVPLSSLPGREGSWLLLVDYRLQGVKDSGSGPELTGRSVEARIVRRFSISLQGGRPQLREKELSTGDFHMFERDRSL
ncbi:MAG: hypothetical protein J5828_00695 [Desulfovibrionaceae bacterium]|nr:hypothetical protein [Desulfovibrionaceae bacterium]